MIDCKHGMRGPCDLCKEEDAEHDRAMSTQDLIDAAVAAERERCAKLCDELEQQHMAAMSADRKRETEHRWTAFGAEVCAHEIRTRG